MILTNVLISDNCSGKSRKTDFLPLIHRIVCVFSTLIMVYYLLMCIFSFTGALQDMRKFEGLGFSYSFGNYLVNNSFPEAILMSLPVTSEFLFYLALYRRAKQMNYSQGSFWYLSIMLVFHTVIWLHANSLDIPESPPFITPDGLGLRYYMFASITILQSVAYFILLILRVRKINNEHS